MHPAYLVLSEMPLPLSTIKSQVASLSPAKFPPCDFLPCLELGTQWG